MRRRRGGRGMRGEDGGRESEREKEEGREDEGKEREKEGYMFKDG